MEKGGLQKQYGPAETFSSVSFMTSCVSAESQRSGDQTAFTAFRRLNSTLAHVLRADRASALTEPFEGGASYGSQGENVSDQGVFVRSRPSEVFEQVPGGRHQRDVRLEILTAANITRRLFIGLVIFFMNLV